MSNAFTGEIRPFAFGFVPLDWLPCNGQQVQIMQYQALYSILGNTYLPRGQSPSQTTFYLPNLNGAQGQVGRALMGMGQGPGLNNYFQGATPGEQQVTLNYSQLPAHSHDITTVIAAANTETSVPSSASYMSRYMAGSEVEFAYSDQSLSATLDPSTLGISGTASPLSHDNMQPYQAFTYCIAWNGVYPTPS